MAVTASQATNQRSRQGSQYRYIMYTASTAIDTASAHVFPPIEMEGGDRWCLLVKNLHKVGTMSVDVWQSHWVGDKTPPGAPQGPLNNADNWITD